MKRMCDPQFATDAMFLKREGDESLQPKGNEDSTQLQQMLTSCMINRQILCCIAGVLVGIPISIRRKSYKPFAILGVLGSFVDYSIPYTTDCRMIHNAMQLALQQERQRDAANGFWAYMYWSSMKPIRIAEMLPAHITTTLLQQSMYIS
ncbi:hypothetical protein PI124_g22368 [Phytophthora idaei]|nr:hypothetical protein PI126_g21770 [Phytophthora idaei]KAG3232549.1 hypothetical protein PI124_g22368 [Phytophthora idaei]